MCLYLIQWPSMNVSFVETYFSMQETPMQFPCRMISIIRNQRVRWVELLFLRLIANSILSFIKK